MFAVLFIDYYDRNHLEQVGGGMIRNSSYVLRPG